VPQQAERQAPPAPQTAPRSAPRGGPSVRKAAAALTEAAPPRAAETRVAQHEVEAEAEVGAVAVQPAQWRLE